MKIGQQVFAIVPEFEFLDRLRRFGVEFGDVISFDDENVVVQQAVAFWHRLQTWPRHMVFETREALDSRILGYGPKAGGVAGPFGELLDQLRVKVAAAKPTDECPACGRVDLLC